MLARSGRLGREHETEGREGELERDARRRPSRRENISRLATKCRRAGDRARGPNMKNRYGQSLTQ